MIERRQLSGDLRIRIDYFQDASCQIPSSALIELVVPPPDHGVCCPIGIAQCSTEGPLGGWAPSLDAPRDRFDALLH